MKCCCRNPLCKTRKRVLAQALEIERLKGQLECMRQSMFKRGVAITDPLSGKPSLPWDWSQPPQ